MNQGKFALNYFRAFKLKLPHTDTINIAMEMISNDELEALKSHLIRGLIEKKIFYKYRIFGRYCNVSVDGTSVMTITPTNIKNFPHALYRIYNKGKENEKIVYFINVLEAKLICANGFCISLGTEWIENPDSEYDKQDCELKAFVRLAEKLKKSFPRLPICIVGDGLYPNETVFEVCRKNNWEWIFTFKEGNLASVWDEVEALLELQKGNSKVVKTQVAQKDDENKNTEKELIKIYSWVESIDYRGNQVHWCKLTETVDGEVRHEFVYLSSLSPSYQNVAEIADNGRLRFKIENEGFNVQKNQDYSVSHKYSESSELATKNYYSCLQIGHMINQLLELQQSTREILNGRETVKNLWLFLVATLTINELDQDCFDQYLQVKRQARFE